jgi:hypothetical protein
MIQPYEQIAKEFAEHPLRAAEVAVEHFISQPLPTLRWSRPAYAGFACPAARVPGQPLQLGTPDRWWAIGAEDGRLLAYALVSAVPFADPMPPGPVTVRPAGRSLSAVREDRRVFGELLTEAAPAFFAGEAGDPAVRGDLAEMLRQVLPAEAMPWHRGLTGDFLDWLERS